MTKMHTLNSTVKATTTELIADQTADPYLLNGWTLTQKGKGGHFIRDRILFHQSEIAGQIVNNYVFQSIDDSMFSHLHMKCMELT